MKACKENRIDVVRLLLRFGADVHAKCPAPFEQKTALYFAVENCGFEIVKLLTNQLLHQVIVIVDTFSHCL
jgi:ankyrin repeat protein